MELTTVKIEKPDQINFILGQSHFIKTIEDIHEAMVQSVPGIKFGVAFCESSGATLVRWTGTDNEMIDLAKRNVGEACLLTGRVDEAIGFADRALTFAQERGQRGYGAYALRLLGKIAAREDPLDIGKAENHYHQALALAEELDMRPLIAHCHAGLGKLYRRTGKQEQAKEHLTTATTMMREVEMGMWLERAEAELKQLC